MAGSSAWNDKFEDAKKSVGNAVEMIRWIKSFFRSGDSDALPESLAELVKFFSGTDLVTVIEALVEHIPEKARPRVLAGTISSKTGEDLAALLVAGKSVLVSNFSNDVFGKALAEEIKTRNGDDLRLLLDAAEPRLLGERVSQDVAKIIVWRVEKAIMGGENGVLRIFKSYAGVREAVKWSGLYDHQQDKWAGIQPAAPQAAAFGKGAEVAAAVGA